MASVRGTKTKKQDASARTQKDESGRNNSKKANRTQKSVRRKAKKDDCSTKTNKTTKTPTKKGGKLGPLENQVSKVFVVWETRLG